MTITIQLTGTIVLIINKENHWFKRKLKEAWMIERIKKSIANRDNGRTLPESYKILF